MLEKHLCILEILSLQNQLVQDNHSNRKLIHLNLYYNYTFTVINRHKHPQTTKAEHINRSLPPVALSGTIHMFVSVSEITMSSLCGFTHCSIPHCYADKQNTRALALYKQHHSSPTSTSPGPFPLLSNSSTLSASTLSSLILPSPLRWIKYNHTCDHFSFVKSPNITGPKGRQAQAVNSAAVSYCLSGLCFKTGIVKMFKHIILMAHKQICRCTTELKCSHLNRLQL